MASAPRLAERQTEETAPAADLETGLARLRTLVERDRVDAARAFVRELVERWPDSPQVQYWARVLAPPVAKVLHGVKHRSIAREQQWLREHRREYPGCWIAVYEDQLIAADPSLARVHQAILDTIGEKDAVIYFEGRAEP